MGKFNQNKFFKSSGMTAPFDVFGITPPLYIKGEEKQETLSGFICSLLMILSILGVVIFYFVTFFQEGESKSTAVITSTKIYPKIDLSKEKFLMMIQFKDEGEIVDYKVMEEKAIKLHAYHVVYKKTVPKSNEKRIEIKIVSCDTIKTDFKDVNLTEGLLKTSACVEILKSMEIQGSQGDPVFSFIEVRFEVCDWSIHGA